MNKLTWLMTCALMTTGCDNTHDASPDASMPTYTARIRGPLAATIGDAKTMHDALASGGQAQSNAAGDFAHQVGLGTTDLDTQLNEFLALDQWRTADGAQAFYANAQFTAGLDALFTMTPSIELFERHPDWVSWGDLGAGRESGQPYWFVVIEGTLASTDLETNHAAHDMIAGASEAQAQQAGDIAHLPHLAVAGPRRFTVLDRDVRVLFIVGSR